MKEDKFVIGHYGSHELPKTNVSVPMSFCKPKIEKKKYIKLYCNTHNCDTEFLVLKKHEDINEYYICPKCEHMVFTDDETEIKSL